MKHRFSLMGRVAIALVLALSLVLVMGVPVAAAVNSVDITAPTTSVKAYVQPGGTFDVEYTVDTTASGSGSVKFFLDTTEIYSTTEYFSVVGFNNMVTAVPVPGDQAEGTYGLTVKAGQPATQAPFITATNAAAVVVDSTNPVVATDTLTIPNGAEVWEIGDSEDITWDTTKITDTNLGTNPITLEYSTDNGVTWLPIASGQPNDGSSTWPVAGPASENCLVRITAVDLAGNTNSDQSDAVFTIFALDTDRPVVTLDSPAAGSEGAPTYIEGADYAVKTKDPTVDPDSGITQVKFEYSDDEGASWNLIGTDTTEDPGATGVYEVPWNTTTLADGTGVWVRATATNGVGATKSDIHKFIVVDNSPSIVELTAPASSDFIAGAAYAVTATASDPESGVTQVVFAYSTDEGDTWMPIGSDAEADADGVYEVAWDTVAAPTDATDVLVRATATNGVTIDAVDTNSGITVDNTDPLVDAATLISPDGGEGWMVGSTQDITWDDDTKITDDNLKDNPINLYYKIDGTYTLIASGEANDGTYTWTVPGPTSSTCKVKVEAEDKAGNKANFDESAADFTMYATTDSTLPTVSLTAPAADETITGTYTLEATATDAESGIRQVLFEYRIGDGGWQSIGTDTFPPNGGGNLYTFDWVTSGLNETGVQLKATATNGIGMTSDSIVVTGITIDNIKDEVWVDDDADESWYDGTHFLTIGAAIAAVVDDGTVNVAAGTYKESVEVTKPLTLTGANVGVNPITETRGAESIIDADSNPNAVRITTTGDVTFQGFTVEGFTSSGVYQSFDTATGLAKILDNIIIGPTDTDQQGNSIQVLGDGSEVKRNKVDGTINTILGTESAGIQVILGDDVVIEDNWVYSADTAIAVFGFGEEVKGTQILRNTVEDSVIGIRVDAVSAVSNTTIKYNVVDGNEIGIESCNDGTLPSGTVANYNNIVNNDIGVQSVLGELGSSGDPLEIVDATLNYWGSPDGPSTGDVSTNVDYSPWLDAPYPYGKPTAATSTYDIDLVAGWNLISLPLIPEYPAIETVLSGLDVNKVAAYSPFQDWKGYDPDPLVPDDLAEMDDGWGYWVDMNTAGTLIVSGYEVCEPGLAVPPDYDLVVGWNLIGFKSTTLMTPAEYLGTLVDSTLEAMYGYDAANGVYTIIVAATQLVPGQGYWLAVNDTGTIYP